MLVYEAGIRKGWVLPGAEAAVAADPHFRVLRDQHVSFFDTTATNVALELPSINSMLESSLVGRRSATLPGMIHVESRIPHHERRYEKLGEDYGDGSSSQSIFARGFDFSSFLDDDDDDDAPL